MVRIRRRSGTPDTFAVNAIVPWANAANGRPEGENVTCSVSIISTYSSLLVCLTLFRRHGIAMLFGFEGFLPNVGRGRENALEPPAFKDGLELGRPTPPSSLFIHEGASTTSRRAFGSVVATMPPSHISPNSCVMTSYEVSILWVRSGDPRKSSSVSATRWRNSRCARGSVSSDEGERNSSRSWRIEYISEGGFKSGAYIREGRGALWER